MGKIECPECGDSLDSRGAWTHLTKTHDWSKEQASRFAGGNPESGEKERQSTESPANSDDDGEDEDERRNQRESDESPSNSGESADEDALNVEHEGSDKLSPDGFESEQTSSVEPPEEVDLPDDVSPDDLEPAESDDSLEPRPDSPESDESDKSAQDIVDDAPDEQSRDRRQKVLDHLDGKVEGESDDDEHDEDEHESADQSTSAAESATTADQNRGETSQMQGGLIDDSLLGMVIGMPFNSADQLSEFDGWKLTTEERETLQKLVKTWAEEKNIDLDANVLLAFSAANVLSAKIGGYAQYRRQQSSGESSESRPNSSESSTSTSERPDEPTPENSDERESESGESSEFDPEDPSTWT